MDILIKTTRISSLKTKTKEETRLERTKIKLKRSALNWDDFMLQDQLKSFMYVDSSLRGDPKKNKLIDELNFTNCMHLSRIKKRKFFVGITFKQRKFNQSSHRED